MKKWKLCNEAILESLQIYGAVKIWVTFAEILVNLNIFRMLTMWSGSFDFAPER